MGLILNSTMHIKMTIVKVPSPYVFSSDFLDTLCRNHRNHLALTILKNLKEASVINMVTSSKFQKLILTMRYFSVFTFCSKPLVFFDLFLCNKRVQS